jgi:hypothetical protein
MKCHCCKQETNETPRGWCFECQVWSLCYKEFSDKEDRRLRCVREVDHVGPCSPMHFKVFSLEEQIQHAFGATTGAHQEWEKIIADD